MGSQYDVSYNKNRESSTQGKKIHLKHALAKRYFLSWAPFSPQSATDNMLAWSERLNFFNFKCRAGHYTIRIDDYIKPKGTRLTRQSSDQDVLIPKCRTKLFQFGYFNRIAKLWNTFPESTRTLTSLNRFKSHALQRYSATFRTNYDVTHFNTWKSICCKLLLLRLFLGCGSDSFSSFLEIDTSGNV